jgi:23S rRNA pseudouridine2605 synthase
MRQNGLGTLTLEEARTWIEETGLCLFLPRRQFSTSIAPSFVEAIAGGAEATPDPKTIALAEELLIRLENEGVAVRLNLQGQPGEQPDFVVAAWVLPYVYALRGDRDWRRSPQLTGSRQVSQLAVHVYKLLEANELNVSQLKQALGREVTESAVMRAISELWQQLRIIPVIAAKGQPAKWQLLRTRFQRAIAEGASTSQVTAISVLASIYLQAVIAATMEDVELFLAALTARSKIREVIRGLVATRQVHTLSLGHAPHFYVAGTLPEFEPVSSLFANSTLSASSYFTRSFDRDDEAPGRAVSVPFAHSPAAFQPRPPAPAVPQAVVPTPAPAASLAPNPAPSPEPAAKQPEVANHHVQRTPVRRPVSNGKHEMARPHHNGRPAAHKPAASGRSASSSSNGHAAGRHESDARKTNGSRPAGESRWSGAKNGKQAHSGNGHSSGHTNGHAAGANGRSSSNGTSSHRPGKAASQSWAKRAGTTKPKPPASRSTTARPAGKSRPALTAAGRTSGSGKRFFNNSTKSSGSRTGSKTGSSSGSRGGSSARSGGRNSSRPGAKKRG